MRAERLRAGGVSRMYGEPIAVTVQDDRPLRFIWRGRLYTVLVALEHWVVSREWWQRNDPDSDVPPEREFWRVEARPGGDAPPAVYELRRDTETGDWLLVRVWDLPARQARAAGVRAAGVMGGRSHGRPEVRAWRPGSPGTGSGRARTPGNRTNGGLAR